MDNKFLEDFFNAYDIKKNWKIYKQNAFKICIKFTNNGISREMNEYRRGNDGSIEIDTKTNKPKVLETGESRWIAIEPSNKSFKYNNTNTYGSAAYPKKIEDAKKHWRKINGDEIKSTLQYIKGSGMIIPYYQIADTYVSLYGGDIDDVIYKLKNGLSNGKINIKNLYIMSPKSVAIGIINNKNKIGNYSTFPTTYGNIPIVPGMLFLLKLDWNAFIKKNKLKIDKELLLYQIDEPAVTAAIWKPIKYNKQLIIKTIKEFINKKKLSM